MSDLQPINDFDAYKHDWNKDSFIDSSNKDPNRFSFNYKKPGNFKNTFLNHFSNTNIIFTQSMTTICVVMFFITLIFPRISYYFAYNPVTVMVYPWTMITSAFIHYGFMHIIFNMITLYYIGAEIEKIIGSWRIAIIFLISTLGGSLFISSGIFYNSAAFFVYTGGASSGIFGLFGTIYVLQKSKGISTTPMIVLIILNLSLGFLSPNISILGHLGGLVFGTLTAYLFTKYKYSKNYINLFISILIIGCIILCYALSIIALGFDF